MSSAFRASPPALMYKSRLMESHMGNIAAFTAAAVAAAIIAFYAFELVETVM